MFSGATSSRITTVPAFEGYRSTRELNANVLLISDPSLILDQKMTIGWYAGHSKAPNFQSDLNNVINSLADSSRLVYFGTSGGGFPALEQASRTPGSTALVVSPLTHVNIERREAVDTYLRNAWGIENPKILMTSLLSTTQYQYINNQSSQMFCASIISKIIGT